MSIPVVDRPEVPNRLRPGRTSLFWDDVWDTVRSLPQGKAARITLESLADEAPDLLYPHVEGYEKRFMCGTWNGIKLKLDLRAKRSGVKPKGTPSPLRHAWSHERIVDSLWLDIWLECE